MPLHDYSNGANRDMANLISSINDNEIRRENARTEVRHSVEQVGLAFVVGTLLQKLLGSPSR